VQSSINLYSFGHTTKINVFKNNYKVCIFWLYCYCSCQTRLVYWTSKCSSWSERLWCTILSQKIQKRLLIKYALSWAWDKILNPGSTSKKEIKAQIKVTVVIHNPKRGRWVKQKNISIIGKLQQAIKKKTFFLNVRMIFILKLYSH